MHANDSINNEITIFAVTSTFFKLGLHVSELMDEMVIEEEGSFDVTSKEPLEMSVRFYEQSTGNTFPDHVFMEMKKGYR